MELVLAGALVKVQTSVAAIDGNTNYEHKKRLIAAAIRAIDALRATVKTLTD